MKFRSNDHEDAGFGLIPDGVYQARITGAEMKTTQAGDDRLSVKLEILGPTHRGRVIFNGFMTTHSNPDVVRMNLGMLKSLSLAARVPDWDHESQLIGATLDVKIGSKPARDGYDASNVVKSYVVPNGERSAPTSNPYRGGAAAVDVNRRGGQLAATLAQGGRPTPPPESYDDDSAVPF